MSSPILSAVIVTYNRAQKLKKCLTSVLEQKQPCDHIIIVNNASTDETESVIEGFAQKNPQITTITLTENGGGAGGFYTGIKKAYALGADYVWIMDDDCYPEDDALKELMRAYDYFAAQNLEKPRFAASHVLWSDHCFSNANPLSPRNDWSRHYSKENPYALLKAASFVSVLIPMEFIKQYGLPIKEYFIWFDDVEFTQRLSERGRHYGIGVMDSIVIHDSGQNTAADFCHINADNIWKYAYNIRNNAAYRLHQRKNPFAYIGYGLKTRRLIKKNKLSKVFRKRLYKAYREALTFKPKIEYLDE